KILDGPVKQIKGSFKSQIYEVDYLAPENPGEWTNNSLFQVIDHHKGREINHLKIRMEENAAWNDAIQVLMNNVQLSQVKEIHAAIRVIFIEKVTQAQQARHE